MGAIDGYEKGDFPGKHNIERTMAAASIASCWPLDRFDVPAILDVAAPDEDSWTFLINRARILSSMPFRGCFPEANAWRQAILETFAWGRCDKSEE